MFAIIVSEDGFKVGAACR